MAEFGTHTLLALLLLATWTGALAVVGARRESRAMVHAARLATYATALVASVAITILAHAFVVSDFSIIYVHQYSERAMPLFYRLAAVWGGQEGSLLLWTWLLALMSAWAVHLNRVRLQPLIPYAIAVMMAVLIFFCMLLLLSSNPFETFLGAAPRQGRGLNPLLQNAYMVTHPPALYIGYVGMTIPFAFAMAALLAGRIDEQWIHASRSWALASWYALSLGLVLGMLWAYEELGWGGYWAWDPVENAGLIPWFTSTAYLHSVMIQERRQMLKIWNVSLAIITFELTLFGTFLTRSGFIQSVHAFARSSIGYYFLGFIFLVAAFSVWLIIKRRAMLRSRGELESVLSREFSFVINNWILLSAAFLVMVLTLFPSISEHFGHKLTISAPAFNKWMIPIGLALLFLKGAGSMIGWRRSTTAGLRRQFAIPLVVFLTALGGLYALGVYNPLALVTFALAVFVLSTVVLELARGVGVRRRARGCDPLTALLGLVSRNRRRYGGYLVHAGIALMFIGFGGEAYKQEAEFFLSRGERAGLGPYVLRFDGIETRQDEQKQMAIASLSLYRDGERLGVIRPARWVYFKHQDKPTTEVDIRRTLGEDLFVVLGSFEDQTSATFKVIINPLVNWIWIGFLLLSLGLLTAIIPARVTSPRLAAASVALLLILGTAPALAQTGGYTAPAPGPASTAKGAGPASAAKGAGPASAAKGAGPASEARQISPIASKEKARGETYKGKDREKKEGEPQAEKKSPVKMVSELERRLFSRLACMCPTCPPIPLSACQCGFAARERDALRKKMAAGWEEERIIAWYLKERGPELGREPFAQAALTTPPDSGYNRLSWLLPYLLSAGAMLLIFLVGRRWVRSSMIAGDPLASRGADLPQVDGHAAAPDLQVDGHAASPDPQAAYEALLDRELEKLD